MFTPAKHRLPSRLLSQSIKIKMYKTVVLPYVFYGCDTWFLTLRDIHRLRITVTCNTLSQRTNFKSIIDVTFSKQSTFKTPTFNSYICCQFADIPKENTMFCNNC
jgi:hypothetical protein